MVSCKLCRIIGFLGVIMIIDSKSYYELLNVKKSASIDDIKRSYRSLAKKYHPDKNKGDPKANERFIELTKAYETLIDESKRHEYDLSYNADSFVRHSASGNRFDNSNKPSHDQHSSFTKDGSTYTFRSKNGNAYFFHTSFTSSSSSSSKQSNYQSTEQFFRQYFGDKYDSHYQSHQSGNEFVFDGYSNQLYAIFEIFHSMVSLAIAIAIPFVILLLIGNFIFRGIYNLFSAILFKKKYKKGSNNDSKSSQTVIRLSNISNAVMDTFWYRRPGSQTASSSNTPSLSRNPSKTRLNDILSSQNVKISNVVPQSQSETNNKSVETPSPTTPVEQDVTPEDRAVERLRLRHFNEIGVILVVALTIKGWNVLTKIKPTFLHDRSLRFLQHINGIKDGSIEGSDADIIAIRWRGTKWTTFYIQDDDEDVEEDYYLGDDPSPEETTRTKIAKQTTSRNLYDEINSSSPSPFSNDAETSLEMTRLDEDSLEKEWATLRQSDPRQETEEWIIKLLNGEIPMKQVPAAPLPIKITK